VFESWQEYNFSLLHIVQTGSGAHPAFYTKHMEDSLHGSKASRACTPYIAEVKITWIDIHSPIRLHSVVFN
jgi:hypothetical protein